MNGRMQFFRQPLFHGGLQLQFVNSLQTVVPEAEMDLQIIRQSVLQNELVQETDDVDPALYSRMVGGRRHIRVDFDHERIVLLREFTALADQEACDDRILDQKDHAVRKFLLRFEYFA